MSFHEKVSDRNVLSIKDLKHHASKNLPEAYRAFYDEGAMDLISLQDNEQAYNRYKIRPRVLTKLEDIDVSTEIFGSNVSFPLGFSPTGLQKLAHPDGELATSRAAASMGVCMALSSYASTSVEDVGSESAGNPMAIQLSMFKDRAITLQLLRRAEEAGYKAVFLSVDLPVVGKRINEFRNDLRIPGGVNWPNIGIDGDEQFHVGTTFDTSTGWAGVIPWLRENTSLQIWLKGVLSAEDIELAVNHGVDGVIISNHGGRQLDGVPASLDALRECVPVAKGRIAIAVDGGIRQGADIFKALAMGAQHCFVGRVPIWGLAYNGQEGVELAMNILLDELKCTMMLAGCRSISDIRSDHLAFLQPDGRLAKL